MLGGNTDHFGPSYRHPPAWDLGGNVRPDLVDGTVGRRAAGDGVRRCRASGPTDVDVCEFYDPFSFEIIRQFEAFGFCGEGEGGDFVMGGAIEPGGRYPITTDGGADVVQPRRRHRADAPAGDPRRAAAARRVRDHAGRRRRGRDVQRRWRGRAVHRRDAAREGSNHERDTGCRYAITNLLYRYAELIDAGDYEGIGAHLAHAVITTDGSDHETRGADAVAAMYHATTRKYDDGTPLTKHVITNPIVEVADDGAHRHLPLVLHGVAAGAATRRCGRSSPATTATSSRRSTASGASAAATWASTRSATSPCTC